CVTPTRPCIKPNRREEMLIAFTALPATATPPCSRSESNPELGNQALELHGQLRQSFARHGALLDVLGSFIGHSADVVNTLVDFPRHHGLFLSGCGNLLSRIVNLGNGVSDGLQFF